MFRYIASMRSLNRSLTIASLVLSLVACASAQTGTWIWQSADSPANTWMCLRKTVSVAQVPSSAVIKIATDTKYWLWVNGTLAVFEGGLKRGPTPTGTYYDEVDIKQYLTTGTNTVAVLVWYFGKDGFSHKNSGKGGLWVESASSGLTLATDATWKVKQHPSYGTVGGDGPNDRLAESWVSFDARKDIAGWMNSGYDDAAWSAASEKGTPPCAPWNTLVKRPIPQWANSGLKDYTNAATLPSTGNGSTIIAKLPYNAQVTPYLKINAASAGLSIDIRTDNFDGGGDENVMATYVTKAGVQEYETYGWMNGHDVRYKIPAGVTITALKYRETGYNCGFVPAFTCNDAAINTLCIKAQRTVYVNMRDNYMDCPDRERAQWIADAALEINIAGYAFDTSAYALGHKAYSNLVQWNKTGGVLFSPVPAGNWTDELPMQMMHSTGWYGMWRYYMDTRDQALLQEVYPIVKAYLLTKYTMTGGLVNHRAGDWDWQDWGSGIDAPVLDNCWYYLALKSIKAMAGVLGITADLATINQRMTSIETNFDQTFWKGTAYSGGVVDDRANALAVLTGLAPASKYPAIRTVLTTVKKASPFLEKFVLEALFTMGYGGDAITRMKQRYGTMISENLSTLWEGWDLADGVSTYNHGWAGGAVVVMAECAVGIAPDSAGYDVFHVLPNMATLQNANQVVETRHGRVEVNLSKQADGFTMKVVVPPGTSASLGVPVNFDNAAPVASVKVNGTTVWPSGTLSGISFSVKDSRYIRFNAQPGTWTLVAGNGPPVRIDRDMMSSRVSKSLPVALKSTTGLSRTVRFDLPPWVNGHDAKATVYTHQGKIVAAFGAQTSSSARLAPGKYLVRMRAEGFDKTAPVVIMQ